MCVRRRKSTARAHARTPPPAHTLLSKKASCKSAHLPLYHVIDHVEAGGAAEGGFEGRAAARRASHLGLLPAPPHRRRLAAHRHTPVLGLPA